jgi:hypothetical protein
VLVFLVVLADLLQLLVVVGAVVVQADRLQLMV